MKCNRPPPSPATIIPSAEIAQQTAPASQEQVAAQLLVSRSHTFSVLSQGRGNCPPPDTRRVAFQRAPGEARFQVPHLQRACRLCASHICLDCCPVFLLNQDPAGIRTMSKVADQEASRAPITSRATRSGQDPISTCRCQETCLIIPC
jgi:hypothetical protein